jgi:hypothetical protein
VSQITLNICGFRTQFPQFDLATISDATIEAQFAAASLYISSRYCGWYNACGLATQTQSLMLMTAHLCAISLNIAAGQIAGVLVNATVDKVTIGLQPPELPNQWQYWLQSTPYGQQLLALLQVAAAGGTYVGGRPELAAFRRPGFYGW